MLSGLLREDVLVDLGLSVGTARAWLAMQSAHDLAAERATGVPKMRKLDPVA